MLVSVACSRRTGRGGPEPTDAPARGQPTRRYLDRLRRPSRRPTGRDARSPAALDENSQGIMMTFSETRSRTPDRPHLSSGRKEKIQV
ncbi:hypothetical protein EA472_16300 [Natrarchaeobius oligotrophus]|uniref:Uncharacterized protein n=1 Tax=Natrarchaeobius chitinivorans TaxID=1679083 RepID=A0A3N6MMW4_NATCH|nr:hypothetical protein EA472_16300 [Natrarchaeobius chitinivorans]